MWASAPTHNREISQKIRRGGRLCPPLGTNEFADGFRVSDNSSAGGQRRPPLRAPSKQFTYYPRKEANHAQKSMGRAREERAHCAAGGDPAGADGAGAAGQDGDRYAVAGGSCASVCLADGHFAGRSDRYADGGRRKRHGRGPAGFRFRTEPRRADELSVFVLHTGRVV